MKSCTSKVVEMIVTENMLSIHDLIFEPQMRSFRRRAGFETNKDMARGFHKSTLTSHKPHLDALFDLLLYHAYVVNTTSILLISEPTSSLSQNAETKEA